MFWEGVCEWSWEGEYWFGDESDCVVMEGGEV